MADDRSEKAEQLRRMEEAQRLAYECEAERLRRLAEDRKVGQHRDWAAAEDDRLRRMEEELRLERMRRDLADENPGNEADRKSRSWWRRDRTTEKDLRPEEEDRRRAREQEDRLRQEAAERRSSARVRQWPSGLEKPAVALLEHGETIAADEAEAAIARSAAESLSRAIRADGGVPLRIADKEGDSLTLPSCAAALLVKALQAMAERQPFTFARHPDWLTIQQAADHLKVSVEFVAGLLALGKLPHQRAGNLQFVRLADLVRFDEAPVDGLAEHEVHREYFHPNFFINLENGASEYHHQLISLERLRDGDRSIGYALGHTIEEEMHLLAEEHRFIRSWFHHDAERHVLMRLEAIERTKAERNRHRG